jgi:hypothetical protein
LILRDNRKSRRFTVQADTVRQNRNPPQPLGENAPAALFVFGCMANDNRWITGLPR